MKHQNLVIGGVCAVLIFVGLLWLQNMLWDVDHALEKAAATVEAVHGLDVQGKVEQLKDGTDFVEEKAKSWKEKLDGINVGIRIDEKDDE